jgi:hypothetical protein
MFSPYMHQVITAAKTAINSGNADDLLAFQHLTSLMQPSEFLELIEKIKKPTSTIYDSLREMHE